MTICFELYVLDDVNSKCEFEKHVGKSVACRFN